MVESLSEFFENDIYIKLFSQTLHPHRNKKWFAVLIDILRKNLGLTGGRRNQCCESEMRHRTDRLLPHGAGIFRRLAPEQDPLAHCHVG